MNLGIQGRKAIVCASSQGLGRGCALALAAAGVSLVINGRNRELLERTAEEIREIAAVDVTPVAADISTLEGQAQVHAACPDPDILVNNNGGPPLRDFRQVDRAAILAGVAFGYDVGGADGKLGLSSRQAIRSMQVKLGLPADSYPTVELLARMRGGR